MSFHSRMSPRILTAALLISAVGAYAESPRSVQITATEVARAIAAAHPELANAKVELPARIEARQPDPILHAGPVQPERTSAASAAASRALVRLACRSESICLPFYATVHLSAAQAALDAPVERTATTGSDSFGDRTPPALRAGQHALLLIDSGPVHIHIPVTCLEGGQIGATIRVESKTSVAGQVRRQIYQAAILNNSTVRASL